MVREKRIRSVAVIGAGASGAITAAALKAEEVFDRIRVFERRETPGGTWIYDAGVQPNLPVQPGVLPPEVDTPLEIPETLPVVTPPNQQERFSQTPIYSSLTTNVPDIAMSFSDARFAYGPFAPHHVPRQYIENYFSIHKTDSFLVLNTTVEDVSRIIPPSHDGFTQWKLTLRKYNPLQNVDIWWEEIFDAVIIANGHYSVPFVPQVKGLEDYIRRFPGRVVHSKSYRTPRVYDSKKVLVIGNSASGHDVAEDLVSTAHLPVYQSRRSTWRWDGDSPPAGIEWKTVIKEYLPDGRILFDDGTYLDDIDTVIYCTGYKPSYPFWNTNNNGRTLWDYEKGKLVKNYWHTFFQDFPSLGIVGLPRVLTFRSFEYQAVALARLFAGRNAIPLPPLEKQEEWERKKLEERQKSHTKFHDIEWDNGETKEWLEGLFKLAGLGTLSGKGRVPPALSDEMIWALEHIRKYPKRGSDGDKGGSKGESADTGEWVMVERRKYDLLGFI